MLRNKTFWLLMTISAGILIPIIVWSINLANTPRTIIINGQTYTGHRIVEGMNRITFTDEKGIRQTFGNQPYQIR